MGTRRGGERVVYAISILGVVRARVGAGPPLPGVAGFARQDQRARSWRSVCLESSSACVLQIVSADFTPGIHKTERCEVHPARIGMGRLCLSCST